MFHGTRGSATALPSSAAAHDRGTLPNSPAGSPLASDCESDPPSAIIRCPLPVSLDAISHGRPASRPIRVRAHAPSIRPHADSTAALPAATNSKTTGSPSEREQRGRPPARIPAKASGRAPTKPAAPSRAPAHFDVTRPGVDTGPTTPRRARQQRHSPRSCPHWSPRRSLPAHRHRRPRPPGRPSRARSTRASAISLLPPSVIEVSWSTESVTQSPAPRSG